ncbi:hypothetical protein GCM10009846_04390 [Agrococcus versicolor]|uniref:DUF222 domain-containing protein n=1 Tax=Agrococcus versicolor TaxID=501482 RepID=A0ABN3AJX1_9MICO
MTMASGVARLDEQRVDDLLPQLRAASMRLLTAVLRLGDDELSASARSALGTRRHVIARMARRADRTVRALDGEDGPEPADRLLALAPADLVAALTSSLGGVLGALAEHASGMRPTSPAARLALAHAREHLAWLELSHVDLHVGYDMHDIPDASLDAVAAHFRDARDPSAASAPAGSSPFAPLIAD